MSRKRQLRSVDPRGHAGGKPYACPKLPGRINTLAYEFADGHVLEEHIHPEDQLIYASRGVMTVRTPQGTWVVPPHRAVWIPARVPHSVVMSGTVSMRTIYFRARLVRSLPRNCCVVNISALLRELILHACAFPSLRKKRRAEDHLVNMLIDQIEMVQSVPLQLPSPSDPRARRAADAVIQHLADGRDLSEICRDTGASKRTIERLFQSETSMTLGEWRQQARLLVSLQLLAGGETISRAALESGYSTPSAFISMFRQQLGSTPKRYFAH